MSKILVLFLDNSDLNLRIEEKGFKGDPITVEGFAFMWAGARANYGVTKGKIAFEVKLGEELNVDHLPPEESSRHVLRIGFSTDATTLQLGTQFEQFKISVKKRLFELKNVSSSNVCIYQDIFAMIS